MDLAAIFAKVRSELHAQLVPQGCAPPGPQSGAGFRPFPAVQLAPEGLGLSLGHFESRFTKDAGKLDGKLHLSKGVYLGVHVT